MREYLPILIVGAIIGIFTIAFVAARIHLKNQLKNLDSDRHMSDGVIIRRLLSYGKPYLKQFILVFVIMLVSIVYDLLSPYLIGKIEEMIKHKFAIDHLLWMVFFLL